MSIYKIIGQNVRLLRQQKGLSQEQIADLLNLPSNTYAYYERGDRDFPMETLVKVSGIFSMALDALIKYDLSKIDLKGLMQVGSNRLLFPILIKENTKVESIEIVPIKASAGYRKGYADPQFIEALPKISLSFLGVGTHRAFQIIGDSMLPIQSESYIVGKYIESFDDIKNNKSYIILTDEDILYKQVKNKINDDGTLHLISNNKYYPTIQIEPQHILEIWQFTCFISTKDVDEYSMGLEDVFMSLNGISKGIEEIKEKILIK
jgi:transcriptional regulator with XRE-family HTH domain